MAKKGFVRSYAYSKPAKPFKSKSGAAGFGNAVTVVGTKVAQWTVRPAIKAHDFARGKKK